MVVVIKTLLVRLKERWVYEIGVFLCVDSEVKKKQLSDQDCRKVGNEIGNLLIGKSDVKNRKKNRGERWSVQYPVRCDVGV